MIAISSFKPREKCSTEIWENQVRAFRSWLPTFDHIVCFAEEDPVFASLKTEFIPALGKPAIKELAECAAQFGNWAAILNADIIITERLLQAETLLNRYKCKCAMSYRYDLKSGCVIDNGLDFFCALPDVWLHFAQNVPEMFCLGKVLWDTFAASFFSHNYASEFADITRFKCVFHPRHGERADQNFDVPITNHYLENMKMPTLLL